MGLPAPLLCRSFDAESVPTCRNKPNTWPICHVGIVPTRAHKYYIGILSEKTILSLYHPYRIVLFSLFMIKNFLIDLAISQSMESDLRTPQCRPPAAPAGGYRELIRNRSAASAACVYSIHMELYHDFPSSSSTNPYFYGFPTLPAEFLQIRPITAAESFFLRTSPCESCNLYHSEI